jgi:hypothetical protein
MEAREETKYFGHDIFLFFKAKQQFLSRSRNLNTPSIGYGQE